MNLIQSNYLVTVILSTYNGTKYLKEQLDSILRQKKVDINLLIRDDGSKDGTVSLLESYKDKFYNMHIIKGANVGATKSFYLATIEALKNYENCEFFALCDQDDIWMDIKILKGIEIINKMDKTIPALYFSNLEKINDSKCLLGRMLDKKKISNNRFNGLASIGTYGCTCVFNRRALEILANISEKNHNIYHDNWLYASSCFLGNVYYDDNAFLYYRQTGINVSGPKEHGLKLLMYRIQKLRKIGKFEHTYERIAKELLEVYFDQLNIEDISYLKAISNYRKNLFMKIYLLFSPRMRTESFSKNVCIIGRILLNGL